MFLTLALLAMLGMAVTWLLTWAIRRYALATQLLDHPNERSSHATPTPRGGGLAIVVALLCLTVALWSDHSIGLPLMAAFVGSGVLVAALGFADDRWQVPARWRFSGHALAAAWALAWMAPIPPVTVFGTAFALGAVGTLVAGCYIVWSINLFNFMDGIDGIASIEAITVTLGGALVWWLAGASTSWTLALLSACCVAGFLGWNYPPARIFMGDSGSGFLGLVVGLLSLWCGTEVPQVFWSWFILFGCFMVDATTTLVRRVRRGEKFHQAHRSHAYQYASRIHGSHKRVSLAFGLINLLWLLPIAVAVALRWLDGTTGVVLAYAPLVWLAFRYKAGDRASQEA